jgi:AcrR family transcriptional regulator
MPAVERPTGTRSRAGNAMGRARSGVLDGALRSVVKQGTKATTMTGIATLGGVAKATVYNHFRTKDEVWAALVTDEVDRAVAATESSGDLPGAIAALADHLAEHPARATLAEREPEVLARLVAAAPDDVHCRSRATAGLARLGAPTGADHVDLVLRAASTLLLAPGSGPERRALAHRLAAALVPVPEPAPTGPEQAAGEPL